MKRRNRYQKPKRWTRSEQIPVKVDTGLVVMHTPSEYDRLWEGVDWEASFALSDESGKMPGWPTPRNGNPPK